jgi:hypothetical protein
VPLWQVGGVLKAVPFLLPWRPKNNQKNAKTKNNTMTYSSSLALGRKSAFTARNQNAVSFRTRERTLGPITNTIMLIVLACVLGLLYLTQVTKTNAYGYQVNGMLEQQQTLKEEHADLEVASARLQSMDRIKNSEAAKGLVATTPTGTLQ